MLVQPGLWKVGTFVISPLLVLCLFAPNAVGAPQKSPSMRFSANNGTNQTLALQSRDSLSLSSKIKSDQNPSRTLKYGNQGTTRTNPASRYERLNQQTSGALKLLQKKQIGIRDIAIKYPSLKGNKLELLPDGKNIWPRLFQDIRNAKHTIHINMFGMTGDKRGWELAKLLDQKANQGVKVVLLADKLGARQTSLWRMTPNERKAADELFKFYRGNKNIQVVFFDRPMQLARQVVKTAKSPSLENGQNLIAELRGIVRLDHRKSFVIDGRIGYIGGMTMQSPSVDKKHDMYLRAKGPIVNQMQSSFLLSLRYMGKKVDTSNMAQLIKTNFPKIGAADHSEHSGQARYLINVPGVKNQVSREYVKAIDGAKKTVAVLNPYITDRSISRALTNAGKRGVKTDVVLPKAKESAWNSPIERAVIDRPLNQKNVTVHRYVGEKGYGQVHGKAVLVDKNNLIVGSANMDAFSKKGYFDSAIQVKNNRELNRQARLIFGADHRTPNSEKETIKPGLKNTLKLAGQKVLGTGMSIVDKIVVW